MRDIDIILTAMKGDISKKAYVKLQNTLEDVLLPSHCDKTDEAVIEAYLNHCRFANYSEGTVKQYSYTLGKLSKNTKTELLNLSHTELKEYLEWCKHDSKPRTISHNLSIISSFYEYLITEDWVQVNPCRKIPRIKLPREKKTGINDIELAKATRCVTNDRDKAIIEFMKATGCRVSEVSKLNMGDIDFKNRTAFIRQAKGKKDRTVSYDAKCEKALKQYLKPFPLRDDNEPVFLRRARNKSVDYLYEPKRITIDGIKQIFRQIKQDSGVNTFHAHALRHYCITKLLKNKMPLNLVTMQAGHSSSSTTLDIYDDVTLVEMQKEYKIAMG